LESAKNAWIPELSLPGRRKQPTKRTNRGLTGLRGVFILRCFPVWPTLFSFADPPRKPAATMSKKSRVSPAKPSRTRAKAAAAVAKRPAAKKKPVATTKRSAVKSAPAAVKAPPVKSAPAPKPVPTATVGQNGSRKADDLSEYRELLLSLRARVRGDVEQMTSEALDRNGEGTESKSPTHLAELGTETYEQDFALRRVENEQELLDEIDQALARIENGTYGLCLSCVESGISTAKAQIPKARLRVIPYARNCVECERKRERWGR